MQLAMTVGAVVFGTLLVLGLLGMLMDRSADGMEG